MQSLPQRFKRIIAFALIGMLLFQQTLITSQSLASEPEASLSAQQITTPDVATDSAEQSKVSENAILSVSILEETLTTSSASLVSETTYLQNATKNTTNERIRPKVKPLKIGKKEIDFTYTDDNSEENLIIKTDKKTYIGLNRAEVYFSVTNTGDEPELVNFQAHFPEDRGEVKKIERWAENWEEIQLSEESIPDLGIKRKPIPQNFKVKKSTNSQDYLIGPGETQYFKMEIQFPPQSSGEFYIEAIGDKNGYGLLDPWWDSNWSYRKQITIDHTKVGADLTNFPVLINLSSDSDLASDAQDDGDDIAFADSSGTQLDHEIENFNGTTGELQAWVEVPSLSSTADTIIYMYYGNATCDSQQNVNGTWDGGNYVTVQHLKDLTTSSVDDSTSNNHDGTKGSANNPIEADGKIYKGQDFSSDQISHGDLGISSSFTAEAWIKADTLSASGDRTTYGSTVMASALSGAGYPLWLTVGKGGGTEVNLRAFESSVTGYDTSGAGLNTTDWFYIVAIATKSSTAKVYVNGVEKLSFTAGSTNWTNIFTLGDLRPTRAIYFDGVIDEIRISNNIRDVGWIVTSYNNQNSPSAFYTLGGEEIAADVSVGAYGSQTSMFGIPSTNQYVGGAFKIVENTSSRNVTGITITEHGTVDAQTNLDNVKLYYDLDTSDPYDCAGESYGGSETQFGSTASFNGANGTASFTGTVGISTTQTMCVYVVLDIGSGATNNETLEIKINNPSTDVTVSSGTVGPSEAIEISGTTILNTPPDLQQIHYRWRNDDEGEGNSPAWYNSSWSYRKKITIDNTKVAGDLSNFPVLIKLASDTDLVDDAQPDFDDILFTSSNGTTKLDHEIEKYNNSTGELIAWVRVLSLSGSIDTDIYMYYGNGSCANQENASGVWDSDFLAVWHMHDETGTIYDSASTNNGTNNGATETTSSGSGYGLDFNEAENDYIDMGAMDSYEGETYVTFEAYFKPDGTANDDMIFAKGATGVYYPLIWRDESASGGPTDTISWAITGSSNRLEFTNSSCNDTNWHYLAEVFDGNAQNLRGYLDGSENGNSPKSSGLSTFPASGDNLWIGRWQFSTAYSFDGIISEARISKINRSANWIATTYNTMTDANFYSLGSVELEDTGATWAANEDTELTDLAKGTIKRLRIEISNEGGQTASDIQFRLEVSESNPSTCAAGSYERVSTDADWEMIDSSYFTDGDPTINVSSGLIDENTTFVAGELKDTGDQTSGITLTGIQFTEIEYSVRATASSTDGATYCFRLTNGGSTSYFTYTKYAEATLEVVNQAPDNPSSLTQKKTDDTTLNTGDWTNETSVKFTATASDPDSSDTLYLCVEKDLLGTSFSDTEDLCGDGVAYSGSPVTVTVTITSITDAQEYHWQARVKDAASEYSSWVSYGGNGEEERDFGIDTTDPTGGTVYDGSEVGVDKDFNDGSLSSLSANWSGFDSSVSGLDHYEYSIGTTPGGTDVKVWTDNSSSTSVTVFSLTLQTSLVYYFNVRAVDSAGNTQSPAISSDGQLVNPSLSFSVSPPTLSFDNLNDSNNFTDSKTATLTTSTNAYGGYMIRAFTTDLLTSTIYPSKTIVNFNGGTYELPDEWQSSDRGFGYNSSDTLVQGANKFNSTPCLGGNSPPCYAPFSQTAPGNIIADHTDNVAGSPIENEQFSITCKVQTDNIQEASPYVTTIVYTATAMY